MFERNSLSPGKNADSSGLPSFSEAVKNPRPYGMQVYSSVRARYDDPATRVPTVAILVLAGLGVLFAIYWVVLVYQLPSISDLRNADFSEASIVYSEDGQVLAKYQEENRTWVGLDSVSTHVVRALIDTEDHRFYQHSGIDVRRLLGSMFRTLKGDVQGGSTLTMQFARNAFPEMSDDWAVTRKIKEWLTALRTEAMYDKDEILEMYLNTVPFMYGAFGIEAAAETYFQKSARDLDLLESATLVGMLKGTVYYNPVRNPERSHERRNVVLQQMVKYGDLSRAAYEQVKDQETRLRFRRMTHEENLAPYFAEYLREWLDSWAEEQGYDLYTDGLRIYTTIDSRLQEAAQKAVQETAEDLQAVAAVEWSRQNNGFFSASAHDYVAASQEATPFAYLWEKHPELLETRIRRSPRFKALVGEGISADTAYQRLRSDTAFMDSVKSSVERLEAGFIAIDPSNGYVKAWVGGRNFKEDRYDHVALAKRQPGSTFKPFVYAAALERGYSPEDTLRDAVYQYADPNTDKVWQPTNAGGVTGQAVTLRDALAFSKNTITAQLVSRIGPGVVVSVAKKSGIESELESVPSIGLGTSEVSLLELTAAYTVFANGGRYQKPVMITRIETNEGEVVKTFLSEAHQALSEHAARGVLDMMRGVVDYGTGVRIRSTFGIRGELAGKTGTTQNSADGWFMLMHPKLVMGAWVGFNNPAVRFRSNFWGQGAHNALFITGKFMQQVKLPSEYFDGLPRPQADTTQVDSVLIDNPYSMDPDSMTIRLPEDGNDWLFETPDEESVDEVDPDAETIEDPEGADGRRVRDLSPADSLNRISRLGGAGN